MQTYTNDDGEICNADDVCLTVPDEDTQAALLAYRNEGNRDAYYQTLISLDSDYAALSLGGVFTERGTSGTSNLEALRSVFDKNCDGKLTAADSTFASFKVMVTKADGTTESKTLAQLGITEIDLTGDATRIELPDGSARRHAFAKIRAYLSSEVIENRLDQGPTFLRFSLHRHIPIWFKTASTRWVFT